MPINLLLALYLVYPRYLFKMGPAYVFSSSVETLRINGYLTLILLTHGKLTTFHRLMKYGEHLSVRNAHPSPDTYSNKCAVGLKTLLVECLLMQNRHLTGEERSAKTREERGRQMEEPLLTDSCWVTRSDPVGMIRGLGEGVTCVYGPAVTYTFPDALVVAYRHSTLAYSCGSVPTTATQKGPIEVYPKFWNLNSTAKDTREVLRIPAWTKCFQYMKKELETILERDVLPAAISELLKVRRMTLGLNRPMVVPSLHVSGTTKKGLECELR